jgi:polyisoprenoid-binding protein YceI
MKGNLRQIGLFVVFLSAALHSQALSAESYRIDSKQSRVTVDVGTGGLLGFAGHPHHISVGNLEGEFQASAKSPESASAEIRIASDSLSEAGEFKEKDLQKINTEMKQNVLETSKHPQIVFKSTKVSASPGKEGQYQVQMEGDLNLHGVSQKITVPATVTLNETKLHATGEFKLDREDFGIETESAGGGTVKVAKEIKVSFDIVALP